MGKNSKNRGPANDRVDSVSEDLNQANGVPAEDQPTAPPIDSPEDVDDQSGVEPAPSKSEDDDDGEDEETFSQPTRRGSSQASDEEGMGFKRVNGKTVDIFDGKTPHTHVRNVGGIMVPLSENNAIGNSKDDVLAKTDTEIMQKLKSLGKL